MLSPFCVRTVCAEFHNAKRSFRLDDPLPRLMSGTSDRALDHIRAYIDNGCNEVEEVDECKKKVNTPTKGLSVLVVLW